MFEALFAILKKSYPSEQAALTAVKKYFARAPLTESTLKTLNETSSLAAKLLITASEGGFTSVLRLLLHKGLNPHQVSAPFGFNVLHHVTNQGNTELVKTLLAFAPSLIHCQSIQGATPLFLAAQQGNLALVKLLLAHGALPNQADIHALTPMGIALLGQHLEVLEALFQAGGSPILFEHAEYQKTLLWSCSQSTSSKKMRSLNLLFAHGAGLIPSAIPDEILQIYQTSRESLKDFFIVAQEKQGDGSFKKRLITSLDVVKKHINDPNWQFEKASLARTCQHPLVEQVPSICALRELLAANPQPVLQPPSLASSVDVLIEPTDTLNALSRHDLSQRFTYQLGMLDACTRSMMQITHVTRNPARLEVLVKSAMQNVHGMAALCHHQEIDSIKLDQVGAYFKVFKHFNALISAIGPILNGILLVDSLPIYLAFDEKLKIILKHHGNKLKQTHSGLYNSLVDARALILAKMTRLYLAQGKHDVAIHLSLESMTVNEQLLVDNPLLQASADSNKALCLVSVSNVYIALGWVSKALRYTSQALAAQSTFKSYDELLISQVHQLADIFAQRGKTQRSLALIDQAKDYLKGIFSISKEQDLAIQQSTEKLIKQRANLLDAAFKECIQLLHQQLDATCHIDIDEENHTAYVCPKVHVFLPHIQQGFFNFFEIHHGFTLENEKRVKIHKETLLSKKVGEQLVAFANILGAQPELPSLDSVAKELDNLHLEQPEETFGFEKPDGFTPIVPIVSARLPKNTLFMTMPLSSDEFTPFYRLICNQNKTDFYPIQAIARKGMNQHGVKLGTTIVNHPDRVPEKVAVGRLKAGGTLRAKGLVEQTVQGENGKVRKLYVFREVVDKKTEQRQRYKI